MCTREECVFVSLGWNVLNISVMSIWSSVSFKAFISLLIFCLNDLSISVRGVLKFLATFIILLMCFFDFVINCFI